MSTSVSHKDSYKHTYIHDSVSLHKIKDPQVRKTCEFVLLSFEALLLMQMCYNKDYNLYSVFLCFSNLTNNFIKNRRVIRTRIP